MAGPVASCGIWRVAEYLNLKYPQDVRLLKTGYVLKWNNRTFVDMYIPDYDRLTEEQREKLRPKAKWLAQEVVKQINANCHKVKLTRRGYLMVL